MLLLLLLFLFLILLLPMLPPHCPVSASASASAPASASTDLHLALIACRESGFAALGEDHPQAGFEVTPWQICHPLVIFRIRSQVNMEMDFHVNAPLWAVGGRLAQVGFKCCTFLLRDWLGWLG